MPQQGEVSRSPANGPRAGRAALDQLLPLVYDELRRIAHSRLQGERSEHTLNTTALVHEAYLKLAGLERIKWQGRAHFCGLAAQAMRQVLVNYALSRKAQKRGGEARQIPLEEVVQLADERSEDLLLLDQALDRLAALDERQSRIIECRFFGGMSIEETAEALGCSPATVKRDWIAARAWLNRELSR